MNNRTKYVYLALLLAAISGVLLTNSDIFYSGARKAQAKQAISIAAPNAENPPETRKDPRQDLYYEIDFSTAISGIVIKRDQLPDFLLKLWVTDPDGWPSLLSPSRVSPLIVSSSVYSNFKSVFAASNADYGREKQRDVMYVTRDHGDDVDCEFEVRHGGRDELFVVFNNPGTGWPKYVFTEWDLRGDSVSLTSIANRTFDPGYFGRVTIHDVEVLDDNNYLFTLEARGGEGGGYHSAVFALWRKPRQLILLREIELGWGGIRSAAECDNSAKSLRECRNSVELTYKFSPGDFSAELTRHRLYAEDYGAGKKVTIDFQRIIKEIPPDRVILNADNMQVKDLDLAEIKVPIGEASAVLDGNDTEKQHLVLDDMRDEGAAVKAEYLTPEIGEALYRLLARSAKPDMKFGMGEPNTCIVRIPEKVLGRIGDFKDKRALPYLLANVGNAHVGWDTIELSLAKLGEPAIEPMFQKLRGGSENERRAARRYFEMLLRPKELQIGEITVDYRGVYDPDDVMKEKISEELKKYSVVPKKYPVLE